MVYLQNVFIVLGYTLNKDLSIHPVLKERLDKVVELHQSKNPIIVCGKGTPPAFGKNSYIHKTEAQAMKDYLVKNGISQEDIYLEEKSMSTLTNAYYSYITWVSKLDVNAICVISNAFHMPSVKYCFHLVYGDKYKIDYVECLDDGLTKEELSIWKERIQKMINEAYPILFRDILPGDIGAISRIVNEATAENPSKKRLLFETKIREIAGLERMVNLRGII